MASAATGIRTRTRTGASLVHQSRSDRFKRGVITAVTRSGRFAASVWALVLALVYFGSAKLGLGLAFANESVTAIWPPTGIALAALVLWGRGLWPGVLLGAFLANVTTDVPVYTAAGIAVGNTLEAVVGAWLLERVGFRPRLVRLRDIFALVVLGDGDQHRGQRDDRRRQPQRRGLALGKHADDVAPCGGSATWGATC